MELTLFELHLDEASFRANAPFAGRDSDDESTDIDVASDESASEGRSMPSALPFVVGLVFLVGVGLAVRRFMGGGNEPGEDADEPTAEPITA